MLHLVFFLRNQQFFSEYNLRNSTKRLYFPKFCYLPATAFIVSNVAASPLFLLHPVDAFMHLHHSLGMTDPWVAGCLQGVQELNYLNKNMLEGPRQ